VNAKTAPILAKQNGVRGIPDGVLKISDAHQPARVCRQKILQSRNILRRGVSNSMDGVCVIEGLVGGFCD
jgi:hypothetical protein